MKSFVVWGVVGALGLLWEIYLDIGWWGIPLAIVVGLAAAAALRVGETDAVKRSRDRFGRNFILGSAGFQLVGLVHTILT